MRGVGIRARFVSILLMGGCCLTGETPAQAHIIDTTSVLNAFINPFGSPNVATMGQTFEVDPPFRVIDSFSLFLGPRRNGTGPVSFRGYLGEWEDFRLDELVYESLTLTRNPLPAEEFLFTPTEYRFDTGGIRLKPNKEYVAFLSISQLPLQPTSGFGMPSQGFDGLDSGEFVFQNNGNDFELLHSSAWSSLGAPLGLPPGTDVWFRASLSKVPEPSSLSLAVAAFLILVASRTLARQRDECRPLEFRDPRGRHRNVSSPAP